MKPHKFFCITLVLFVCLFVLVPPAQAYIGPGAGFAFVSSFFAIIAAFFLAFLKLITAPFRSVIRSIRWQIQINFPQHQVWVDIFKSWWTEGMRAWRQRNADDATLIFLCELGPPPYAITDADQNELSDRWEESLQIRDWALEIWSELEA